MLLIALEEIDRLELQYPGIKEQVLRFENKILPVCSFCGSANTAEVHIGFIGRTIAINACTTKFKMIGNPPRRGEYFCNKCGEFFDSKSE